MEVTSKLELGFMSFQVTGLQHSWRNGIIRNGPSHQPTDVVADNSNNNSCNNSCNNINCHDLISAFNRTTEPVADRQGRILVGCRSHRFGWGRDSNCWRRKTVFVSDLRQRSWQTRPLRRQGLHQLQSFLPAISPGFTTLHYSDVMACFRYSRL